MEQSISLAELEKLYPDRWLAVNVEKRDKNGQPTEVTLIEKNMDLYNTRRNITADDICILFAGSVPQSGVVLML
ncbi:hypothetical protein ACFLYS_03315 [Chloroflexota bacterium]